MNRIRKSLKVEKELTLKKVSTISKEKIAQLLSSFPKCEPIQWPTEISEEDSILFKKYDFNPYKAVEEDTFVLFNFPRSEGNPLVDFINEHLKINTLGSLLFCSSYFAHPHDDKEVTEDAGQVMIVVENKLGHKIFSKNKDGVEQLITPEAGDVIFLDIFQTHAIFPNQKKGMKAMRKNPIKLVCFN